MAERILLVDDHPLTRSALAGLLGQHGFDVVGEAADGEEAISCAEALQPDLILLDLSMPGLDGLSALPRLREAAPACEVVVLTASGTEENLLAAIRGGAAGYLLKTESPTGSPTSSRAASRARPPSRGPSRAGCSTRCARARAGLGGFGGTVLVAGVRWASRGKDAGSADSGVLSVRPRTQQPAKPADERSEESRRPARPCGTATVSPSPPTTA